MHFDHVLSFCTSLYQSPCVFFGILDYSSFLCVLVALPTSQGSNERKLHTAPLAEAYIPCLVGFPLWAFLHCIRNLNNTKKRPLANARARYIIQGTFSIELVAIGGMPRCETSHSEGQLWNWSSRCWFHISYFSNFVMLEVPHVIISEMLESGKFPAPGGSGRGEEKALMELLFEELICAPERLGFSIPNETNYMIFIHIAHPFT